jgi:ribokinase
MDNPLHLRDPGVIVVGSVNVDLVMRLPALPSPGETVIGGELSYGLGGKGCNAAVAAARLGADTALIGRVGRDEYGEDAIRQLRDAGVRVDGVGRSDHPTGVAAVLADRSGENLIAVASGANAHLDASQVEAWLTSLTATGAAVLANLEVPTAAALRAAQAASARGWPFILDPAPARELPDELLALCDVITPNRHELAVLAVDAAALRSRGATAVVVTEGALGASVDTPDGHWRQPAMAVDAVDSTGAGDAFAAALAVGLAGGDDLARAVQRATAAGALATRGVGAQASLPTAAEVERLMAAG